MKKLFKKLLPFICIATATIAMFSFAGCSGAVNMGYMGLDSSTDAYDRPSGSPLPGDDYVEGGITGDGDVTGTVPPEPDGSESGGNVQQHPYVKQLTAAEWRDAHNYGMWLELFAQGDNQTPKGIFYGYSDNMRGLETANMHEISVKAGDNPVVNAKVKLYGESGELYSAVTDSAGKAYVFGNGSYVEAVSGNYTARADIGDGITEVALENSGEYESELEIMLVVDTTGSMSDELRFLCDELAGVIARTSDVLDCKIRLGFVFYRDKGDDYVTCKFDLTDVSSETGLSSMLSNLKAQSAAGGGDYPEAVDTALAKAVSANWNESSKTKLLFQILDAPYHDESSYQKTFSDAVKDAAGKGIRIIPVAASGLNTLGQFTMRSASLMTGGTYTFITDDSGIGNSHELPDTGEFTVEYLSDLMVRLIKGYYTGTFDEPVHWLQSQS